jgi:hypothetical protein
MAMDPVLLIGRYEGYDRDLFLAVTDDVRTWSPDLSQVSSPFVALVALDAAPVGADALSALATRLVGAGCRYALAWGAHAGSIYIAFFDESKERDRAGLNRRDDYLMVDDLGDEPLDNALWHAVVHAKLWLPGLPDEVEARSVLVVTSPEYSAHVELRLSDGDGLSDYVVDDDDASSWPAAAIGARIRRFLRLS